MWGQKGESRYNVFIMVAERFEPSPPNEMTTKDCLARFFSQVQSIVENSIILTFWQFNKVQQYIHGILNVMWKNIDYHWSQLFKVQMSTYVPPYMRL